jgi:hypothetical protein
LNLVNLLYFRHPLPLLRSSGSGGRAEIDCVLAPQTPSLSLIPLDLVYLARTVAGAVGLAGRQARICKSGRKTCLNNCCVPK